MESASRAVPTSRTARRSTAKRRYARGEVLLLPDSIALSSLLRETLSPARHMNGPAMQIMVDNHPGPGRLRTMTHPHPGAQMYLRVEFWKGPLSAS